ncbi:LemA family protein [Cellulophaga sp. Z1A5H]|uniref:LemA family protein n=1 Tax=Cellulophaga sp. Z1A5H TaxID=2687291 RepID=UPI0013FE2305|nr:LemA family protein [Cellulophaga sp. Z1A5H]
MKPYLFIIIIALIVLFFVRGIVSLYNRLVLLRANTDKNFANIDVLLKQRADEVPELVKIVKRYMEYEENLLTKVTELRTQYLEAKTNADKVIKSNALNSALGSIMVVSENYPELKANASFSALQSRVSELENHLADRRELYNDSINLYNIGINEFPDLLIAKPLGFKNKQLLQITPAEKKYDGIQF